MVLARKIPGNEYLINHNENGLLFQTPEVCVIWGESERERQRTVSSIIYLE